MNNHFFEIKPHAREGISSQAIISDVVQKIHTYLSIKNVTDIGISFPLFSHSNIGEIIRLHSSEERLVILKDALLLINEAKRFRATSIKKVPEYASLAVFKRHNFNQNNARATRHFSRYEKQHGHKPSVEYQIEYRTNIAKKVADVVLITLTSNSNGNRYPFFIKKMPYDGKGCGKFSHFGLSDSRSQCPVPIF